MLRKILHPDFLEMNNTAGCDSFVIHFDQKFRLNFRMKSNIGSWPSKQKQVQSQLRTNSSKSFKINNKDSKTKLVMTVKI